MSGQYIPYRTAERHFASVVQAADAATVCLLKEMGEPESGAGAALRLLQFLPYSFITESDTCDAGGNYKSRVEFERASGVG